MNKVLILHCSILFIVSLCATWWIFKKVLRIAVEKNIVDNPDSRKLQRVPVPLLGGIAVFFGILVALTVANVLFDQTSLFSIVGVMVMMLYIGTMDDILSLSPNIRFLAQIIAVLLIIYGNDISFNNFYGLWGLWNLPDWFAVPMTVFACVGIINSINLIDGVNGLSSGYCIIACSFFAWAYMWADDSELASLAIICLGALIPFFFHNVFGNKSRMFIGDGGTLLMGTIMSVFVLGVLNDKSIFSSCVNANFGTVPFVLSMLAIPVFDTIRVMFVRIIRGTSPFRPDKTHLHHLLLDLHFSHIGTTMVEILANFGVVGSWYLSYKLGASIDVQTYVVIGLGLLITFGFYKFARVQERRKTKVYYLMTKIGDLTHVEDKNWFKSLTKFLDRGY